MVSAMRSWPYLTADEPGLPGEIKSRPEDFQVEELPAYPPSGEGTHTYLWIEKTGITTLELIRRLARALGRKEKEFGYAGLKDARAVTRQMVSLEHVEPQRVAGLEGARFRVLRVARHVNKIKLGHLAGNRFDLKVRNVPAGEEERARTVLAVLEARGVPNYFGLQRFGVRGDNWLMGRAIVREDAKGFVDQFCGKPGPVDRDDVRQARERYEAGQFAESAEAWPGFFRDARRACLVLAERADAYGKALAVIDRKLKRLFVSAYQSYLFNEVLARRLTRLDRMEAGDLAYKHVNGAVFLVADETAEQPRAAAFEISPTGPLYGYRMRFAEGEPGRIEHEVLAGENLTPEDFQKPKAQKVAGSRRPMRVPIRNLTVEAWHDDRGPYLRLAFDMPAGAYATAVLRELMKEHLVARELGGAEAED